MRDTYCVEEYMEMIVLLFVLDVKNGGKLWLFKYYKKNDNELF